MNLVFDSKSIFFMAFCRVVNAFSNSANWDSISSFLSSSILYSSAAAKFIGPILEMDDSIFEISLMRFSSVSSFASSFNKSSKTKSSFSNCFKYISASDRYPCLVTFES